MWKAAVCIASVLLLSGVAAAAVDGFVETFSGTGPFDGFDNPGWELSLTSGEFADGGFRFANGEGFNEGGTEILKRIVGGSGPFVSTVEIADLDMGDVFVDEAAIGLGSNVQLFHRGPVGSVKGGILVSLAENTTNEVDTWVLRDSGTGQSDEVMRTPSRGTMQLKIFYDGAVEYIVSYDNNINDDTPPIQSAPAVKSVPFDGIGHEIYLTIRATEGGALNRGVLTHFSVQPLSGILGDFNGNEVLDADDVTRLSAEILAGTNDEFFDLNDDTLVNELDRDIWVHDVMGTFYGDADLNGFFDSVDLLATFAEGEYDDDIEANSTWATGDWNGDLEYDSDDLLLAFADGGYELEAAQDVPEPSALLLVAVGVVLQIGFKRSR